MRYCWGCTTMRGGGHAGPGKLTQSDWRNITVLNASLAQDTFGLKSAMTVKVQFMEWTRDKNLRQPSIQEVVSAAPEDCTVDQL